MSSGGCAREGLDPLLRYDLDNRTKVISVETWVNSVLDVSPEKLSTWSNQLSNGRILLDPIIESNMKTYNERKTERDCHQAWSLVANQIIKLARTHISGLPEYPLPNLLFVQGDLFPIDNLRYSEQSPDIIVTLQDIADKLRAHLATDEFPPDVAAAKGINWDQILSCVGFRQGDTTKVFDEWTRTVAALRVQLQKEPKQGWDWEQYIRANGLPPPLQRRHTPHSAPILEAQYPQEEPPSKSRNSRKRKLGGAAETAPVRKRLKVGVDLASAAPDPREVIGNAARYALELLANTSGTRSHCLQLIVDGSHLQFWYYDAGGIICSEPMCWVTEFNRFAAIIVAFASLDLAGWGVGIPNLTPPVPPRAKVHLPESLNGYTLSMVHHTEAGKQKVQVVLGDQIFAHHTLVGRRTAVYDIITVPQIGDKPLVLKMSMQDNRRVPEHELLNSARAAGVEHLPEVHMWTEKGTEWRLSKGVRRKMFPENEDDREYEDRCQRLVVFTKYQAVEGVISPTNFHSIFGQLIDCVHDLRYKANILHRDISLGNLMYELREGSIWLILNDYDLATYVDENGRPVKGSSPKHRTGTLPFMAVDILKNLTSPVHYIRHDLESVFWVALWCLVKLPHSKDAAIEDARRQTLLTWEEGSLDQIKNAKYGIINDVQDFQQLSLTPEMLDYQEWIFGFRSVIRDGYRAIDNANNDRIAAAIVMSRRARRGEGSFRPDIRADFQGDETLGNVMTREKIISELKFWEDERSEEDLIPYYRK